MKTSIRPLAAVIFALLLVTPVLVAQNMPIAPEASILNVTEPLDVGGTVLQPGSYLIKVLGSSTDRNKVQILSRDGQKVFATVLAVPHQLKPNEEVTGTTFVYYPATTDHPRALRTWFASNPPGQHGHDIVYAEGRAKQLAVASNDRVVSYPNDINITEDQTTTLSVQTPQSTVETYTYTPPPAIVTESTTTTTTPAPTPMVSSSTTETTNEMPNTASRVPMFALLGLISIAAAVAIRFVRS